MQKICALILLTVLVSNYEALPQTKWSRQIHNSQSQLTRERRQFPFGEWIPLSQPCPTCRPFADPLDVGLRSENIGLTPPRPSTVTRQIHGDGNFFPQDESSILSVPPPPPSAIPRQPIPNPNGNFQFSNFGQFNAPLPVPTQKIFPQTQQIQFVPQTFLSNQPVLVNGNQQILPGLNAQNNFFTPSQQIGNEKVTSFSSDFKTQKLPENVVLEQNKRPISSNQPFGNKPQPFAPSQNQKQTFVQQQNSVNFGSSILSPPPVPNNLTQNIVIPGLDKEEIQLLYVPVETLRQRGTAQEQLLTQQPQNIQFFNKGNNLQQPVNNIRPTEQTLVTRPKGHFVTQNGNGQKQADSSLKVTSTQSYPTTITPSTLFLQHLPFQQTPQPFVSATPATPTIQPFVTPGPVFQKFSSFTPETTLSHLSTVPNTVQFSQSNIEFGTTQKTLINQELFNEKVTNDKSQFSEIKNSGLNLDQKRPLQQPLEQTFVNQQQVVTQPPLLSTTFSQEQKDIFIQNQFPHQIDQQRIALQKQQEQQLLQQQQRELEQLRFADQQRKQKELEEQRVLQQHRQKELEHQRLLQKQKELEEQRLIQQRQKELEQRQFLQKQKEIEERRLLQQRQKELEQQQFLQKQKELEEQRLLQQRQKDLEEQRFLQEQRRKELENQRRLQSQKQKELDEKRRLKQKEEEERLLRFQQQQKAIEQQRLLQEQQEEQQRLIQQEKLQKQKLENLKKQQQFQFFQQQQQQQQQQHHSFPSQGAQQSNRHVLPTSDKLNLVPELEKESEVDDQLVPHQPPLSVFFKTYNGAEARITDVLRELRSSNTITVLDQYFEKMPKVFVGPAGLIPPSGYGKFELPYLSNLESDRTEKRIDKLPFFVAPLNFIPPPGYAKIPFPAPHVGSVVVSSETNSAMTTKPKVKEFEEEIGSFPVVGPELPGLINNLNTISTTIKPTTYVSTPSLPQTTAQLRNRRPNSNLYKPQNRKPITRTRLTTTSKPEEEVTQPLQKTELTKDSESSFKKPFNRFLSRRRQQVKTTTESSSKGQQDGKSLENRFYSVEVYHQDKNEFPRTQPAVDFLEEKQNKEENQFNQQFDHPGNIDRITPSGHGVFEVRPTPDFSKVSQSPGASDEEEHRPEKYFDINLQTFEEGPLPTGSARTITQELYRPNAKDQREGEINSKAYSKFDSTTSSIIYQPELDETVTTAKFLETSDVSLTAGLIDSKDVEKNINIKNKDFEKQDASAERFDVTEASRTEVSFTPDPVIASREEHAKGFLDSNEQYTSAFSGISKSHDIPGFVDSTKSQNSDFSSVYPTQEISYDLQAPLSQQQQAQEFDISSEVKLPQNSRNFSDNKFGTTGSVQQYSTELEGVSQGQKSLQLIDLSPTVPVATVEQQTTSFSIDSQNTNVRESDRHSKDHRIGSFISFQNTQSTSKSPVNLQQYFPSSTPYPSQPAFTVGNENNESPSIADIQQSQALPTRETVQEVAINPSVQTYTSEFSSEVPVHVSDEPQNTKDYVQDNADSLPNDHRLKLLNPSIVRVRTRLRGKSRGQVNFTASQLTTPVSFTRSETENRNNESPEQENTTRANHHFLDYHPTKTSKYNQFRGTKKSFRTTTENTAEYEQKLNVYTIRPQRRPLNPSTVSTKRVRRPTTSLPSAETATEAFSLPTSGSYSLSEHSEISPSGVSNDVYYEQASQSSVKHKLRKHFGSAQQKNDFVPAYESTPYPSTAPTYSSFAHDQFSQKSYLSKDLTQSAGPLENPEKYPEWNPSESGFDVSGIVLTTIRTPGIEEQSELEEPKKTLDSKKAFDPDLEKKGGRRRVRVRVHKRPHENFETAESQNLRTVANVLVPPTTTYKPNDESAIHQLAKNSDFSFEGQKLFGIRSREYFRKRLNLTQLEGVFQNKGEENEQNEKTKILSSENNTEKVKKDDEFVAPSKDSSEGNKLIRPKLRSFVRKVIKHGGSSKGTDSESNQVPENEEIEKKQENSGSYERQPFRVHQGGFNNTGRLNGTRHKTFVRYIKKNKVKQYEGKSNEESSSQELQEEEKEQGFHQTTESSTSGPEPQQISNAESKESELQNIKKEDNLIKVKRVKLPLQEVREEVEHSQESQTTQQTHTRELQESSSERDSQATTPSTHLNGLHFTQKSKFYQTLRPIFQRTTQTGFQGSKESGFLTSTTQQKIQEPQEKRKELARLKFGKTTTLATANKNLEENKEENEQHLKSKTFHTSEVRKYLRTKSREGAFSQFSKNKYITSEKTETKETNQDQESIENESKEISTDRTVELSSSAPKTTQAFAVRTDSLEVETETEQHDHKSELQIPTTEAITSSEEEEEEDDDDDDDDEDNKEEEEKNNGLIDEVTSPVSFEVTTETEIPTTVPYITSSKPTGKVSEPKTFTQTTEVVEDQKTEYQPDIYKFSKNSFSFDEAEKFTGTKNRVHVRNITADIIENTASFSAPGVEKRPDVRIVTHQENENFPKVTESYSEKTEVTTEYNDLETTTDYPETAETEATVSAVTKAKIAKILKTSTTTKVSHETEICYKGKCIRTKSENPDEDLKLLVDSANIMKIEKTKT